MNTRTHFVLSLAVLTTLVLAACAGTPTSLPEISPTSPATTNTSSSAATPKATSLPTQSPTATSPIATSHIEAAFVAADNNVYTWSDGSTSFTQITASGDAQTGIVSQDGNLVAYTRTTDGFTYTLDVVNSDGTNHRTLFTHADFLGIPRPSTATDTEPFQFAWVPNSHMLALTVDYVMQGTGLSIAPDMILFNTDDGTFHTLLSETENYQFFYSPDGSKIAIALPDGIDLFDSNGNQLLSPKFYSFTNINTMSETAYLPDIIWSSDSSRFAFTIPPAAPFTDAEALTQVVEINAQSGSAAPLLTASMAFQMPQEISPGLTEIAYLQTVTPSSNEFDLHIDSLAGNPGAVYASNTIATDFSWSPDSVHFVYAVASGATLQAYLGQILQSPTRITEVTDVRGFVWLDANRFLILDKTISGWKIWLDTIGSTPTVIYLDSLLSGVDLSLSVNR